MLKVCVGGRPRWNIRWQILPFQTLFWLHIPFLSAQNVAAFSLWLLLRFSIGYSCCRSNRLCGLCCTYSAVAFRDSRCDRILLLILLASCRAQNASRILMDGLCFCCCLLPGAFLSFCHNEYIATTEILGNVHSVHFFFCFVFFWTSLIRVCNFFTFYITIF